MPYCQTIFHISHPDAPFDEVRIWPSYGPAYLLTEMKEANFDLDEHHTAGLANTYVIIGNSYCLLMKIRIDRTLL